MYSKKDDGKEKYEFVGTEKRKIIKKFNHSKAIPGGYLQFRLNKARSFVSCMLGDIRLDYIKCEREFIDTFVNKKKEELNKAFLENKDAISLSETHGFVIGGDIGFDYNKLSKMFQGDELFGNPHKIGAFR